MRRGWIVTVGRNIYTIDNNLRPRAKDGEFVEQICTVQRGGGWSRLQDETGFGMQSVLGCPLLILYSLNILAWLKYYLYFSHYCRLYIGDSVGGQFLCRPAGSSSRAAYIAGCTCCWLYTDCNSWCYRHALCRRNWLEKVSKNIWTL